MIGKQKKIFFLTGFLILVWLAYEFSFSKTIEIHKEYSKLKLQDDLFLMAAENMNNLKQQEKHITSLLRKYQISSESSFQNNLLSKINRHCLKSQTKIIRFNDVHRFQLRNNAIQETYQFTIESDFISILNFVYSLEVENQFGKIISLQFKKKKNYRTKNENLFCTVFLQRVIQEPP